MRADDEQDRLRSGRAVAAALLLTVVVLAAFTISLLVLLERSCAAPRASRGPVDAVASGRPVQYNPAP